MISYDHQIAIFGQDFHQKITNQRWFLVGCGALGCEYMKSFALMGVGTGGTVMGVGRALREHGSKARIVAVEPDESAVLSGDKRGKHGIQGLADGFIPDLVKTSELDQVIRIKTDDAIRKAQRLSREEGLLVGISSGANILAATQVAEQMGPGNVIVTVLPDRGERYLSLAS